jgi:hypothetical protein
LSNILSLFYLTPKLQDELLPHDGCPTTAYSIH